MCPSLVTWSRSSATPYLEECQRVSFHISRERDLLSLVPSKKRAEIKRMIFNSLLKRVLPRLSACHAPESQQGPLWTQSGAQGGFSRQDGVEETPCGGLGWLAPPITHPPSLGSSAPQLCLSSSVLAHDSSHCPPSSQLACFPDLSQSLSSSVQGPKPAGTQICFHPMPLGKASTHGVPRTSCAFISPCPSRCPAIY